MPTEMLTRDEHRISDEPPQASLVASSHEWFTARQRHAARMRRLKVAVTAWGVWTTSITALWVVHQWNANGAFQSFGHEGETGQWNPTLWAVGVGLATLVVGIMALGVYFSRPPHGAQPVRFHIAAWLFGMAALTPLWALIEWQDNGGFERWSNNSTPGDWDPWILTVGVVWAVSALALLVWRRVRRN